MSSLEALVAEMQGSKGAVLFSLLTWACPSSFVNAPLSSTASTLPVKVQTPYSYSINVSTVDNLCAEMSSLEALVAEMQGSKGAVLFSLLTWVFPSSFVNAPLSSTASTLPVKVQTPYCLEFTFERSDSYVYSCYR